MSPELRTRRDGTVRPARYRSLERFGFLPLLVLLVLARPLLGLLMTPAYFALYYLLGLVRPYAVGDGWNIFQS